MRGGLLKSIGLLPVTCVPGAIFPISTSYARSTVTTWNPTRSGKDEPKLKMEHAPRPAPVDNQIKFFHLHTWNPARALNISTMSTACTLKSISQRVAGSRLDRPSGNIISTSSGGYWACWDDVKEKSNLYFPRRNSLKSCSLDVRDMASIRITNWRSVWRMT